MKAPLYGNVSCPSCRALMRRLPPEKGTRWSKMLCETKSCENFGIHFYEPQVDLVKVPDIYDLWARGCLSFVMVLVILYFGGVLFFFLWRH